MSNKTTIMNDTPSDFMFTLPMFYRVQTSFPGLQLTCQFDYINTDSLDRICPDNKVALFKVRPKHQPAIANDLYERSSI